MRSRHPDNRHKFLAMLGTACLPAFVLLIAASPAWADFSDNFTSYKTKKCYAQGASFGAWTDAWNGGGCTKVITASGAYALQESPTVSTSPTQTNSALTLGPSFTRPYAVTATVATTKQLRTGSAPNPWEAGWVLWDYSDRTHFYYFIPKPNGWELGREDPAYPGNQDILAAGTTPTFPIGSVNSVQISQSSANQLSVTVNGHLITSYADAAGYTGGRIGLYTEDATAKFSNIDVSVPQPVPTPASSTPTVTITSPAGGTSISGPISVTGTASASAGVASVSVAVDGNSYEPATGTGTWSYGLMSTSLTNGPHTIAVKATDTLGNSSTASEALSVQNPVPTSTCGTTPAGMRPLSCPLFGVTVDDVSPLSGILAAEQHLAQMPTTRVVFDTTANVSDYAQAVGAMQPSSYLMGSLLDSSEETSISASAEHTRVSQYLAAYGNQIDVWEIGNEVNGNWLGSYSDVSAKLVDAYDQVAAAGKRTALTLYYDAGCGNGPSELDPISFTNQYVPQNVRDGLDFVLLSYYEPDCGGQRPSAATWTSYFQQLHALYPNAKLGFGEIGLDNPVTSSTLAYAESVAQYYYGLNPGLPYYIGGGFWWYFAEDAVPYSTQPMWSALNSDFALR